MDLIRFWIKEMADFGITNIAIGGGEPFMRNDLVDIVKEIKSYGMRCSITTSGYLVGKVPFPPVDECVISIDGAKAETHDAIRGTEGSWKRAIHAVKVAKTHCTVKQLNFVLLKDNYHELPGFIDLAVRLDLPVSVIPVSMKLAAQTPLTENLIEFDLDQLSDLLDQALKSGVVLNNRAFLDLVLAKLAKGAVGQQCMAPNHCILIYSNGDIYPCGNLDMAVGNLSKDQDLRDLFSEYDDIRKEIWSGRHPFCNRCIYPDIMNRATLRSGTIMYLHRRLIR